MTAALLLAALVAPACDRSAQEDTSGSTMLGRHPIGAVLQQERWSVSAEPAVEIGVVEGDPRYMFGSVIAARLLPDGRIVVADRQAAVVRVYDPVGRFEVEMGGSGAGPGEFQFLSGLWVDPPDTIRAWDSGNMRITTFLADGSLVGTRQVDRGGPEAPSGVLDLFVGPLSDGEVALGFTIGSLSRAGGIRPDRIVLARFGADGRFQDVVGEELGLQRYGSPVVFSPFPYAAVYRDTVYFTNGLEGRIVARDREGEVVRTITLPASPVEPSEAWSSLEKELEARRHEEALEWARAVPSGEAMPTLAGLLIDDRGLIWAKAYDPMSDAIYVRSTPWAPGGEWQVVTRTGEPVARVAMPEEVLPLDIRGDLLLGLSRGPFDVERVVVHTLERETARHP